MSNDLPRDDATAAAPAAAWQPARERVYSYVRDQILRGHAPGGSFLEEEQVSTAVGVSRTPVREAFHRLEAERFIDLLPRRGAMVRQVTVQELINVYETRVVIETHAARRLCQGRIPVPEEMAVLLAEMRRLPATDLLGHVELNGAFHRALVSAAGNEVLTELYDSLRSRQQRVAMTSVATEPGRRQTILDEHGELLDALGSHDAEAAAAVLARHLRPVFEVVSRLPGYIPPT